MPTPTLTNVPAILNLIRALQNADELTLSVQTSRAPAPAKTPSKYAWRDLLRDTLERLFQDDPSLALPDHRNALHRMIADQIGFTDRRKIGQMVRHMRERALEDGHGSTASQTIAPPLVTGPSMIDSDGDANASVAIVVA